MGVAAQYCGALGKTANCQVAVAVHAVTDDASCPLSWRLFLPESWTADPERCLRAGIPAEQIRYREKWRLALESLDEACGWGLDAPLVLADAAYGAATEFRPALESRGLSYVLAIAGHSVAQPADAAVEHSPYGGLGPPTLPRYRTRPRTLSAFATDAGPQAFTDVTWRSGSAGPLTSRFPVVSLRPVGKQATAAAQAAGGGHYRWDGGLPMRTVLVEWPPTAWAPTDYWISDLPADTPLPELVRLAKLRWRTEHDYRKLKHGLVLDHYEGRSW